MEKIKLTVQKWDGQSLVVTSTCDELETNDGDYCDQGNPLAFQPAFFDQENVDNILQSIARSCVSDLEHRLKLKKFSENIEIQKEISFTVGNTYEWTLEELYKKDIEESNVIKSDEYYDLTVEEKLSLAGISIEELKKALGLSE